MYRLPIESLKLTQQYIQTSVFKHIESGTIQYVNEMRVVSIIFIQVPARDSLDLHSCITFPFCRPQPMRPHMDGSTHGLRMDVYGVRTARERARTLSKFGRAPRLRRYKAWT